MNGNIGNRKMSKTQKNCETKAFLQHIIDAAQTELGELTEEYGYDVSFYYGSSLDEYGIPFSHGNYDDVYSDGHDNGSKDGEVALAEQLLEKFF